jgi:ribosomal protein L11 methyltransferase
MISPPLWKASVTLPKDRVADVVAVFEITPAPAPQAVLIAEDPFGPKATVEALYAEMPDAALLSRVCGNKVRVAALRDQDWIKKSQRALAPVRAGCFFIYGAHDKGKVPRRVIPICIEAGMAFGTGHHETTALCLKALTALARETKFRNVLDLGCGTGVLAIAAAKLWREPVTASDIDHVAVAVTMENAAVNGEAARVHAVLANGLDEDELRGRAPFDFIVANILSGPLTKLAKPLAAALAPGGVAVLSGLMRDEEDTILRAYTRARLKKCRIMRDGPWSALILSKPHKRK